MIFTSFNINPLSLIRHIILTHNQQRHLQLSISAPPQRLQRQFYFRSWSSALYIPEVIKEVKQCLHAVIAQQGRPSG